MRGQQERVESSSMNNRKKKKPFEKNGLPKGIKAKSKSNSDNYVKFHFNEGIQFDEKSKFLIWTPQFAYSVS